MKNKIGIIALYLTVLAVSFLHRIQAQDGGLPTYIEMALENNPELAASKLKYEISREKQEEVNTLPNTEFGFGYFISEPETRTGAQKARFSIKQMIPWFGSVTARENYAASMAEADYQNISTLQRRLIMNLSTGYYNLYTIEAKNKVVEEQLELIRIYRQLALTAVETGSAGAVDILKLQIRENDLENKKEVLNTRFEAGRISFFNTMGVPADGRIVLPDTLEILPEALNTGQEVSELHPELLQYDELFESAVQFESLNRKESSPNLGLGLDYIPVAERTDINPSDNGKDIIMPMVSVSIPIFNNKYRSVSRQTELRKKSIELEKQERKNQLETMLAQAKEDQKAARLNIATAQKNIEETNSALEILLKSFQTGTADLNDLLDILEIQLNLKMTKLEELNNYYKQLLIIKYLSK